jgi:hypothetical protein
MIAISPRATPQMASGFLVGAALTAAAMLARSGLAQTPIPAPDAQLMLDWCRQMMASMDPQAMMGACLQMMAEMMSGVQGMMGGMCMMGR